VQALPGVLGQGVLINEPAGVLQFGANPLPAGPSVTGVPSSNLEVTINGVTHVETDSAIDTGTTDLLLPSSLLTDGTLPVGTTVTVSTSTGVPLYTQTITSPFDVEDSGGGINTGNYPFTQQPIYLSYSPANEGTFTFDE
jgi:hypothetical protein